MFKTKTDKLEVTAENYPLPDGFDDPDGPFYVPEQMREAWAKYGDTGLAHSHTLLNATIRQIAYYELEKIYRPDRFDGSTMTTAYVQDGDGHTVVRKVPLRQRPHLLADAAAAGAEGRLTFFQMSKDAEQNIEAHLNEHADRIRPEAQHAIRLKVVLDFLESDLAAERERKQKHLRFLCPVCGESDPEAGPIATRELVPSMGFEGAARRGTIHSCPPCYSVALEALAKRAADQQCGEYPHMRTRAQIIDSYLNEKGL